MYDLPSASRAIAVNIAHSDISAAILEAASKHEDLTTLELVGILMDIQRSLVSGAIKEERKDG